MKASPEFPRVVSPLPVGMVEVEGRIVWVDEVGSMVEVGGKQIEIDDVEEDEGAAGLEDAGAAGILGAAGFEAGRVNASEGGNFVRAMVDPRLPTEEEAEHHKLTHLPYTNWCPESVKAKGEDLDHRSAIDKERKLSANCCDYCFPGDAFGFKVTVSVGTERLTGMKFATAVPTKGSSGKFAVDKTLILYQRQEIWMGRSF